MREDTECACGSTLEEQDQLQIVIDPIQLTFWGPDYEGYVEQSLDPWEIHVRPAYRESPSTVMVRVCDMVELLRMIKEQK